ncbi:MAG: endonuclease III [Bacilli bacterium]|nr:endonuclease III [Bacilli bacterium]
MKTNNIFAYLDELFPNPRCELNYNKDYELLLAVMLSAQTTDKRVNQVTGILFEKYPSVEMLAEAPLEDIERIIKPIGTYHVKAKNLIAICKKLKEKPISNDREYLESLNGVGRKTANVVLSELYNEPCLAVDTHITRIAKRLKFAKKADDVLTIEKKLMKIIPKENVRKIHHQLIFFGRYHCKAIKPNCENCKLKEYCQKDI